MLITIKVTGRYEAQRNSGQVSALLCDAWGFLIILLTIKTSDLRKELTTLHLKRAASSNGITLYRILG